MKLSSNSKLSAPSRSLRKTGLPLTRLACQAHERGSARKQSPSGSRSKGSIRRGPGKHWLSKPAVVHRGEREICNPATPEGRAEYAWRKLLLWVRQDGICCNCRKPLTLSECTFEHEEERAAGRRDDRLAIIENGQLVRHLNGVSHRHCNRLRGSTKTPIYHGNNYVVEGFARCPLPPSS
jgi:hypothetical protein